jgi:hypothetical protein
MLNHGRQVRPRCSATYCSREPTPRSGSREPCAAAAVGRLPAHPPEARHWLVRPAVLDRTPVGVAGLEVGLNDRPTGHGRRLASPRFRVVLDTSRPSGGRPQVGADVRRLVLEMAIANPLWGAPRIHGELLTLGFDVSERTISRLMPRRRRPPSQTWRTFLKNHLSFTVAVDFFRSRHSPARSFCLRRPSVRRAWCMSQV